MNENTINGNAPVRQFVYVDEHSRILGVTTIEHGTEVFTEINCFDALNENGVPKYKYAEGEVIERSAEEIAEDEAAQAVPVPSWQDTIEAQVIYTAMMTDTLIEEE